MQQLNGGSNYEEKEKTEISKSHAGALHDCVRRHDDAAEHIGRFYRCKPYRGDAAGRERPDGRCGCRSDSGCGGRYGDRYCIGHAEPGDNDRSGYANCGHGCGSGGSGSSRSGADRCRNRADRYRNRAVGSGSAGICEPCRDSVRISGS